MRSIKKSNPSSIAVTKQKPPKRSAGYRPSGVALCYKRISGSAVILVVFILEEGLEPIVDEHRGDIRDDYNNKVESVHYGNPLS